MNFTPDTFDFDILKDTQIWIVLLVIFFAGIIRGYTGFGSALLAVPALAFLYGPVQAVVIEVLIEIPVCLGLLPNAVKHGHRRTVLPMLIMFALFVPVGALLLKVADPNIVKILISLFVLFAVILLWQQARFMRIISPKAGYVIGAISGTSQGLTGMAGPLFATALLARGEDNITTRANIAALATGIVFFSVVSFWAFGLLTAQIFAVAVLATPAMLLGVWLGALLFHRALSDKLREVILCFLAITALVTLWDAVV